MQVTVREEKRNEKIEYEKNEKERSGKWIKSKYSKRLQPIQFDDEHRKPFYFIDSACFVGPNLKWNMK